MTRLTILIACFLAALGGTARAVPADDTPRRPNFLIIFADDLGRELLDCYGGQSGYETPRLNQLAADGLRFNHCYATPMCTPSRVEILTGEYSFRNYTTWSRIDPTEKTFANHLKNAGYATAFAGKWQMGGWDLNPVGVVRAGFDEYCSYDGDQDLVDQREGLGNRYWGGHLIQNGRKGRLDRYGPDVRCDFLIDFIRRHRDAPFLVHYCLTPMHRPFQPTPEHPDAPAPGEQPPADWMTNRGRTENFEPMLRYADGLVGRLLDTLDELGIAENTVVIFTSDNGTDNKMEAAAIRSKFRNRQVAGGKYFPTQLGVEVPLLVRWPGKTAPGGETDALVDLTDILPTLCEIAGADPGADEHVDGRSFVPSLTGRAQPGKPFLYTWGNFDHNSRRYKDPAAFADALLHVVRDQNWKLYSDGRLFNLDDDYFEERPLAAGTDDAADAARTRLEQSLSELRTSAPKKW